MRSVGKGCLARAGTMFGRQEARGWIEGGSARGGRWRQTGCAGDASSTVTDRQLSGWAAPAMGRSSNLAPPDWCQAGEASSRASARGRVGLTSPRAATSPPNSPRSHGRRRGHRPCPHRCMHPQWRRGAPGRRGWTAQGRRGWTACWGCGEGGRAGGWGRRWQKRGGPVLGRRDAKMDRIAAISTAGPFMLWSVGTLVLLSDICTNAAASVAHAIDS